MLELARILEMAMGLAFQVAPENDDEVDEDDLMVAVAVEEWCVAG